MKQTILSIIIGLALLSYPLSLRAQEAALSIAPSQLELLVKPGRTMEFEYTIKNLGDPTVVRLSLKRVEAEGDTGTVRIARSHRSPILFSIDDKRYQFDTPIILKSGQKLTIPVEAEIPESVSGDFYYTLIAESDAPPIVEGSAATRTQLGVGSVLLLSVAEQYPTSALATIGTFKIQSTRSYSLLGNDFELIDSLESARPIVSMSNAGPHFIQTQGTIVFEGLGGPQSFSIPKTSILAESSRRFYELEHNAAFSPRLLIGTYRVTLQLKVLESGETLTKKVQVFVFPFKLVTLFLLIACAAVLILIRNRIRRATMHPQPHKPTHL